MKIEIPFPGKILGPALNDFAVRRVDFPQRAVRVSGDDRGRGRALEKREDRTVFLAERYPIERVLKGQ